MEPDIRSLRQLLDTLRAIDKDHSPVDLDHILQVTGRRSFGPILLVAGLITLAPLVGDIPGVPTLMALLVILTSGQLLAGRRRIWLPRFLRERSVTRHNLERVLDRLERPARFMDRFFRPRLSVLVMGAGSYLIGSSAMLVALIMPILEFIPFSATLAGAALTAFGLSLIARDGYLAIFSLASTVAVVILVIYHALTW
ncbi:MAG: exopolysaccharide biosynthesis protein [Wenzhouxiangella sp.]|nr:exopolysaccharide biosynthesis protein [Wenzhouxiangella sp.]